MPGKQNIISQDIDKVALIEDDLFQPQSLLTTTKATLLKTEQPLPLQGETTIQKEEHIVTSPQPLLQEDPQQAELLRDNDSFLGDLPLPRRKSFGLIKTAGYYSCPECDKEGLLVPESIDYACQEYSYVTPLQQSAIISNQNTSQVIGTRQLASQVINQRIIEQKVVDEHVTTGARVVSEELRTDRAQVYEETLGSSVETEIIMKVTTPIQRTIVTPVEQKIVVPIERTIVTNVAQKIITPVEKTIMTQVSRKVIDYVQKTVTEYETRTIVVPVQKTITVPVQRTVYENVPRIIVENVRRTVITPVTQKVVVPVKQTFIRNIAQTTITPVTETFVSHEGGFQPGQFIQQTNQFSSQPILRAGSPQAKSTSLNGQIRSFSFNNRSAEL